jgi:hypothetical protein
MLTAAIRKNEFVAGMPDAITPQIQTGLRQAQFSGDVRARSSLIAFLPTAGLFLFLLLDLPDLADGLVEIVVHGLRERGLRGAELFVFVLGLRAGGVGADLAGVGEDVVNPFTRSSERRAVAHWRKAVPTCERTR